MPEDFVHDWPIQYWQISPRLRCQCKSPTVKCLQVAGPRKIKSAPVILQLTDKSM